MNERSPTMAIVGGGLAGLAAAAAAVECGFRVELFEQAGCLGGRAGSFLDSATGDRIDHCQHVAMGCCTAFLDFCRRAEIEDCFERSKTLHFIGPEGSQYQFVASRWLPVPLHLLPGLLGLKYLTVRERWGIVRALTQLARQPIHPLFSGDGTIGDWLRRHGQSDRAIERFWSAVVVGALSETVDRASLAAARKVFCDGFLVSRGASDLLLPRLPLGEIFCDRLGKWLADRGVTIHLRTPVREIEGRLPQAGTLTLADGTQRGFDAVIVAVPWRNVRPLLAENLLAAMPELAEIDRIEPAAITAVHLWFDRPITQLPHAVLVGRLSQWLFYKSNAGGRHYFQVVISASHRLDTRKPDALLAEVRRELEAIWPAAGAARLLHSRVMVQPAAVFSMQPGIDRLRPPQQTPIKNLALAGDWTDTGWPGTMEGAIRSGSRAVEALRYRGDATADECSLSPP